MKAANLSDPTALCIQMYIKVNQCLTFLKLHFIKRLERNCQCTVCKRPFSLAASDCSKKLYFYLFAYFSYGHEATKNNYSSAKSEISWKNYLKIASPVKKVDKLIKMVIEYRNTYFYCNALTACMLMNYKSDLLSVLFKYGFYVFL